MSELINASDAKRTIRWKLLSTVSIAALLTAVYGASESKAANQDADRPTVWIELGGQMEHIEDQGDSFAPGFLAANPNSPVLQTITPLQAQRPAPFNFDEEGKISLQPEGSDWIVSVGVIYGRSGSTKHIDHQVNALHHNKYVNDAPAGNITSHVSFADTHAQRQQSHTILDFSVGRDVGVGMFGREGTSVLGIGVRIAQFTSRETFDARAAPDLRVKYLPSATAPTRIRLPYFHTYHFTGQSSRSFHGIGPSLSWSGSAPVVGTIQNGEVMFDWGANAALLFGRQEARVGHFESRTIIVRWRWVIHSMYWCINTPAVTMEVEPRSCRTLAASPGRPFASKTLSSALVIAQTSSSAPSMAASTYASPKRSASTAPSRQSASVWVGNTSKRFETKGRGRHS